MKERVGETEGKIKKLRILSIEVLLTAVGLRVMVQGCVQVKKGTVRSRACSAPQVGRGGGGSGQRKQNFPPTGWRKTGEWESRRPRKEVLGKERGASC